MAVAVRHWSPEYSWQSQADHHSYIAVNLLKQRIASITTRPDAVLGAVITMVFGAALACDDIAWKIHIEGLVQIINDRESRDPLGLPSWLIDLIVQCVHIIRTEWPSLTSEQGLGKQHLWLPASVASKAHPRTAKIP